MLNSYSQNLTELILSELLRFGALSAKEIHLKVGAKRGRTVTLQGVYKELKSLAERGVVVKRVRLFSVKLNWVVETLALLSIGYEHTVGTSHADEILPTVGERSSYRFRTLSQLVDFWSHASLVLISLSKDRAYFDSVPFIWYHFVNLSNERQYLSSLSRLKGHYYLVSRNDSWVDRTYLKLINRDFQTVHFGRGGLWSKRLESQNPHLSVCGDYLIELSFPAQRISNALELYSHPKSEAPTLLPRLAHLLGQPGMFILTIRHDPTRAKSARRKFYDFLGLRMGGDEA